MLMLGLTGWGLALQAQNEAPALTKAEKALLNKLEARSAHYGELAHRIWELAELGFMEDQSTQLLQAELTAHGFEIEQGVAGMPTAFVASYGSGKPVIGLLAEYDALPGMAQEALPRQQKREGQDNGHACGHHLFGTASVAAAVAVKEWLAANKLPGTVRLYGTPAEEGGGGKIFMVRAGLFDDVDAVITWHPSSRNRASAKSSLAAVSMNFKFYGHASHAAAAPERGRSALDGIEAFNFMVNLMREHVPQETRIHYAIKHGGGAPNIVPAFAEVAYIIRHPDINTLKAIIARVERAAEAAALGTETRVEMEREIGYYNILPNEPLARLMHQKLQQVGGVSYTPEERAFAEGIIQTFPALQVQPEDAMKIDEFTVEPVGSGGSTDVGDISWVVPTASMNAATWVPGTTAHSWQAVAAGGTSIGTKGMMVAAKTLSLTAVALFQRPEVLQEAKATLLQSRGPDFEYECLVGDQPPPLDYRKQ